MPYSDPKKAKECSKNSKRRYRKDPVNRAKEKAYNKKWRAAHPEQIKEYNNRAYQRNPGKWKAVNRRLLYGLSEERYQGLLSSQRGLCAVCKEKMDPPHVDHCHVRDAVRELLCGRCNPMLGFARDDPVILQAAILYLRRHS